MTKYFSKRDLNQDYKRDVLYLNMIAPHQTIVSSMMTILDNDIVDAVIYFAQVGQNLQSDLMYTIRHIVDLMSEHEIQLLKTKLSSLSNGVIENGLLTSMRSYLNLVIPDQLNGMIIDQVKLKCLSLTNPANNEDCKSYIRHNRFMFDKPLSVTSCGDVAYKKDFIELKKGLDLLSMKVDHIISRRS